MLAGNLGKADFWRAGVVSVTGSRPTAEARKRAAGLRFGLVNMFATETEIAFSGQSREALLLLLCARIGYTPPVSVQR
jgi:hypothetical protein